ncbi:MAG: hypothetical protein AAGJ18_07805 [Bacteroidota bacterium]
MVTASFNHNGFQKGKGSIDFWKLRELDGQPNLVLVQQYLTNRGVHFLVVD